MKLVQGFMVLAMSPFPSAYFLLAPHLFLTRTRPFFDVLKFETGRPTVFRMSLKIPGRMACACVAHILSFLSFPRRDTWLFTPLTIE